MRKEEQDKYYNNKKNLFYFAFVAADIGLHFVLCTH